MPALQKVWSVNGRFTSQRVTGVQRYAREILGSMDAILDDDLSLRERLRLKLIVPPEARDVPPLKRIEVQTTRFGSGHLWDQVLLPYASSGRRVLSLCNTGPLIAANHVICIHDMNTFVVPKSYSRPFRALYRVMLPALARRARQVVTVSNFSARMIEQYGLGMKERILIAPNGHEHALKWGHAAPAAGQKAGRRPYVFLLGSRAAHKNVEIVLQNAAQLDHLGLDIVTVGAAGSVFQAQAVAPVHNNVIILGYVDDAALAGYLANALCFVFPSLTEGFGLPVLEAMAQNCPVVCSNVASLPEVAGDAALYADPRNPGEWLDRIAQLAGSPQLQEELRAKGRVQAQSFSWRTSARSYLDLLSKLN